MTLTVAKRISVPVVCQPRQARNLGHEDQVDLTLQSADYKVSIELLPICMKLIRLIC